MLLNFCHPLHNRCLNEPKTVHNLEKANLITLGSSLFLSDLTTKDLDIVQWVCLSLDLILDYWTIGPSQDFFSFVCKQVGKLFRMLIKERKLLQEHIAALWDAETASAAFEMVMQGDPINKWESDLCHCIMKLCKLWAHVLTYCCGFLVAAQSWCAWLSSRHPDVLDSQSTNSCFWGVVGQTSGTSSARFHFVTTSCGLETLTI